MDKRGKYERVATRAALSLRGSSDELLLDESYLKVRMLISKSQNGFFEFGVKGKRNFMNIDNVLSVREVPRSK